MMTAQRVQRTPSAEQFHPARPSWRAPAIAEKSTHTRFARDFSRVPAAALQRAPEPAAQSSSMPCPVANTSPANVAAEVLFAFGSATLTPKARASIRNFMLSWGPDPIRPPIRVDGYASVAGPAARNLRLSCDRAIAVKNGLIDVGIPESSIDVFAQGETESFGEGSANQRATIASAIGAPQPEPPACGIPESDPGSCSARHDAYCAAAACHPTNSWLKCVCKVSADICRAVDAFTNQSAEGTLLHMCIAAEAGISPVIAQQMAIEKGQWFLRTNSCIWKHWRNAVDAIHMAALPIPAAVTPEWYDAVIACRTHGVGSSECCAAHVLGEQHAIDHCGGYPTGWFGRRPTDVPARPSCSYIADMFTDPPRFDGDFGSVSERIAYGNTLCCS